MSRLSPFYSKLERRQVRRKRNIAENAFYRWCTRFAGINTDEAIRIRKSKNERSLKAPPGLAELSIL